MHREAPPALKAGTEPRLAPDCTHTLSFYSPPPEGQPVGHCCRRLGVCQHRLGPGFRASVLCSPSLEGEAPGTGSLVHSFTCLFIQHSCTRCSGLGAGPGDPGGPTSQCPQAAETSARPEESGRAGWATAGAGRWEGAIPLEPGARNLREWDNSSLPTTFTGPAGRPGETPLTLALCRGTQPSPRVTPGNLLPLPPA